MNTTLQQRINTLAYGTPPNGYHKSKLGLMPDDWSICTLGSITSRISDKNGNNTTYPAYSINNQIGFIPQSEQFEEGSYGDLNKSSYKIVEKGQFAYNPARINVGSIGVLKDCEKAIVSSLYVCFSVSDKVDQNYLENWFRTFDFFKEIIRNTEGSVREYLFYENFANIRMRLPPLAEQKKIAEILGCCDELIRLKKELIAEKKKQKKALMQKLLDPNSGFRLPGFAGEWKKTTIGEIASVCTGSKNTQDKIENGSYPFFVRSPVVERINSFSYDKEAVLTAGDGAGTGKIYHYYKGKFDVHQRVYVISDFIDISGSFFYLFFSNFFYERIVKLTAKNTVDSVRLDMITKMPIAFPSDEEQNLIVLIASAADHEIDLLEQELSQQERKKKSLMQLLLTGIVRVLA